MLEKEAIRFWAFCNQCCRQGIIMKLWLRAQSITILESPTMWILSNSEPGKVPQEPIPLPWISARPTKPVEAVDEWWTDLNIRPHPHLPRKFSLVAIVHCKKTTLGVVAIVEYLVGATLAAIARPVAPLLFFNNKFKPHPHRHVDLPSKSI